MDALLADCLTEGGTYTVKSADRALSVLTAILQRIPLVLDRHSSIKSRQPRLRHQSRRYLALIVGWLVGCLTSQQHGSVSQGRVCSDNLHELPH